MKQFNFIHYLFFIVISIFLLVSCNDEEEEPTVDDLVGKYQLSSVELANDFMLADTVAIPAGTEMTFLMQNALFGSANCNNPQNTRIELQENGQIFLLCEGENKSTQNGTWSVNDQRTELTLNININFGNTTLPFQLTMTNLTESGSSVSGIVQQVPLPPSFFMAFGIDLSGTQQQFYNVDLDMTITEVQ